MAAGERNHPPMAGYPRCAAEDKALGAAAAAPGVTPLQASGRLAAGARHAQCRSQLQGFEWSIALKVPGSRVSLQRACDRQGREGWSR